MLKKLISLSIFTLFAFTTHAVAAPRAFRVIQGLNGCGLAWGVKGQLIDFEAVEAGGNSSTQNFRETYNGQLVNYLVDLETNAILDIPVDETNGEGSPEIQGHIGATSFHNYFSLELTDVVARGNNYNESVVMTMTGGHWYSAIDTIYLIRKSETGVASVVTKYATATTDLERQMIARLPTKLGNDLQNLGPTFLSVKKVSLKDGSEVMSFTELVTDGHVGKTELNITGTFQINVEPNGGINLKLLSVNAKEKHLK